MVAQQDRRSRLNNGLLQPLEAPFLAWLARRLPQRARPDHLTLLGVVGAMLAFAGYGMTWAGPAFLWLASAGLVINWVGDSLDGTLARHRSIERPRYGYFLDHTTDMLSQLLIGLGLGLSAFVRFDVACLALISYLVVTVLAHIRTNVSGTLEISFFGFGPTEVRVGLLLLNAGLYFLPKMPVLLQSPRINLAELALLIQAIGTLALVAWSVAREARLLAAEDPPRQ